MKFEFFFFTERKLKAFFLYKRNKSSKITIQIYDEADQAAFSTTAVGREKKKRVL